jgi:transcriptional regulator with XRE-family HTH domain
MGVLMGKKRNVRIVQDEAVRLFAARLREVRQARGLTQAELGRRAHVTASYVWRLENAGASPGIDLVARLAAALETTSHDLLPVAAAPPDTVADLRALARTRFESLVGTADREMLLMLDQLLARLAGAAERGQ